MELLFPMANLTQYDLLLLASGLVARGLNMNLLITNQSIYFFLLLTPENSTGGHLKVLAQISKLLKRDQFKKGLIAAESVDEIYNIIKDQDEDF